MTRPSRPARRRWSAAPFVGFAAALALAVWSRCAAVSHERSAHVGPPATLPQPARKRPAGPAFPSFPFTARSDAVQVFADVEQPVEELRAFAERTLAWLRNGLGAAPARANGRCYRIYLCGELETMRRIEAANGWPRSDPAPERTFEYRGGFYPDQDMVLLRAQPGGDMRAHVAHELSHAVFQEVVGQGCDAIDEGLACYFQLLALDREPGPVHQLEELGDEAEAGTLPTLAEFFALDYWQFRDARLQGLNFLLSLLLVRVLLEDESSELAGRFPRLLDNLRAHEPWRALRRTYDVGLLEAAWQRRIDDVSRWFPVHGEWSQTREARTVTLWEAGTAVLVRRAAPRAWEPYSVRVRLAANLSPSSEIGFVLGYQGPRDYQVLILRRWAGGLVVATCRDERWGLPTWTRVRDMPLDWTAAELALECSADGTVELRFGGRALAVRKLGAEAFAGRVGLYLEPRAVDADGARRAEFEYVDFCPEGETRAPR